MIKSVPISLLLAVISIIVSYESFVLLKGSAIKKKKHNNDNNQLDEQSTKNSRTLLYSQNRMIFMESVLGFVIGFLGGLVGLILGSIRMPAMISILKMGPRVAVEQT